MAPMAQHQVQEDTSRKKSTLATTLAYITVRAQKCEEVRPGVWQIAVPARELSEAEIDMIHELFPTLAEQAHTLLQKESLLNAITTR